MAERVQPAFGIQCWPICGCEDHAGGSNGGAGDAWFGDADTHRACGLITRAGDNRSAHL